MGKQISVEGFGRFVVLAPGEAHTGLFFREVEVRPATDEEVAAATWDDVEWHGRAFAQED